MQPKVRDCVQFTVPMETGLRAASESNIKFLACYTANMYLHPENIDGICCAIVSAMATAMVISVCSKGL